MSSKNKNKNVAEPEPNMQHADEQEAAQLEAKGEAGVTLTEDEQKQLARLIEKRDKRRAYSKTRQANLTPEQKAEKLRKSQEKREAEKALLERAKKAGLA